MLALLLIYNIHTYTFNIVIRTNYIRSPTTKLYNSIAALQTTTIWQTQ